MLTSRPHPPIPYMSLTKPTPRWTSLPRSRKQNGLQALIRIRAQRFLRNAPPATTQLKAAKNGTGPALWNVVGRPAGVGADFSYSPAMASSGIRWNYAELDAYLTNPKAYVPKTKMAFIGVKKPADRAAVIEYLRLASDAPLEPLTEAAAIPGAEVELNVDGANPEASADLSVDGEIIATETVDEAVDNLIDEAADVVDAVEDVVEEVVEDVKDAMSPPVEDVKVTVPAPDGGH